MSAPRSPPPDQHPDDGVFIRLLDGECSAEERESIERHAADCGSCAGRRRVLVEVSQAVARALAAADPVMPPLASPAGRAPARRLARWWWAPALRAAAVLLALAAVASAQPVRRWIVARWEALRGVPPPPAAPLTPPGGSAVVRFAPAGPVFTIEVATRQAAGMLTVELISDSIASARVTGGDGSEELVVLPGRLRIVNRPTTLASYHVRLPAGLREVRVVIADALVRQIAATPGAPWTFELNQD